MCARCPTPPTAVRYVTNWYYIFQSIFVNVQCEDFRAHTDFVLLINGVAKGLYAFMEAPDQDYVFQRSFPKYNKANFSLFKFKSMAIGGCAYVEESFILFSVAKYVH